MNGGAQRRFAGQHDFTEGAEREAAQRIISRLACLFSVESKLESAASAALLSEILSPRRLARLLAVAGEHCAKEARFNPNSECRQKAGEGWHVNAASPSGIH